MFSNFEPPKNNIKYLLSLLIIGLMLQMDSVLRPYQEEGIKKIFDMWKNGEKSVLFQMPTGTGKTVLFSEIVKKGHDRNRKILIIAHRKELIEQIVQKLQTKNISAGIILSGVKPDNSKIVQVASIQTLSKREHPEANLIIIDECHHATAKSYKKLWDIYPNAKFLGVTATPIRLDKNGFKGLFEVLIPSMQIKEFIKQKYLSEIKHFIGAVPDLKNVKKYRGGDYVLEELGQVMHNNSIMASLVDSYQNHAFGKSMIVFAVNVDHSKNIVERYQEKGISAVHIDAKTPPQERKEVIEQFKANKIKVLSNVEIITEGFDFPECEVVQLARPTKSLALYLQMVGRVMRKANGKEYGLVLDNAGMWLEHGLATIDREWLLEETEEKEYTDIVAKDENGVLREVNRIAPQEIEGLELIEMTEELKRLIIFESYVTQAIKYEHKLTSAYYKYEEYLKDNKILLTHVELEYIENRLNKLNKTVSEEKRFKKGFWFYIKHKN